MPMSVTVLLFAAGTAAGLAGTVAGLASLFSYPALLACGLPATAANVTNTVALAVGSVTAVPSSRPELTGQAAALRRLVLPCAAGSAAGAALLLMTPPGVFERVVPVLVGGASLTILAGGGRRAAARRARQGNPGGGSPAGAGAGAAVGPGGAAAAGAGPGPGVGAAPRARRRAATVGTFAVTVYSGYFAAASGVVLLALLLATTAESLTRATALRNVLMVVVDAVAALGFAAFGPVDWTAAVPLTAGLLLGSWLGPRLVRVLPAGPLRVAIGLAGLGLAVKLAYDAF